MRPKYSRTAVRQRLQWPLKEAEMWAARCNYIAWESQTTDIWAPNCDQMDLDQAVLINGNVTRIYIRGAGAASTSSVLLYFYYPDRDLLMDGRDARIKVQMGKGPIHNHNQVN